MDTSQAITPEESNDAQYRLHGLPLAGVVKEWPQVGFCFLLVILIAAVAILRGFSLPL